LLLGLLALSSIALTSVHSFLFFHSVAELAGIAIALALFLLVWNAKGFLDNGYLLLLGIAYGAFSIIDLLHTLAYDGMGVFDITGANLATQFWIAGRYMQAPMWRLWLACSSWRPWSGSSLPATFPPAMSRAPA
jgi:hypothetical protein